MRIVALKIKRFLSSEDGPTAVEYAVLLALIISACFFSIHLIGRRAFITFHVVNAGM